MLIEIIRNTPRWVFLLIIVLLVMGYQQSRDRTASRRSITILPVTATVNLLYGLFSGVFLGRAVVMWRAAQVSRLERV